MPVSPPDIIAIRTDASPGIGSGHIRRMSILARYLKAHGFVLLLLCGDETEAVFPDLRKVFTHVHEIGSEQQAVALLDDQYRGRVAAVFFDHYALGAPDHALYRKVTPFLAGIDDMANRLLDVDMLFDVNLGRTAASYEAWVPETTQVHAGSRFQIINPEFFEMRAQCLADRQIRAGRMQRIFIAMGGTDPFGMTIRALRTAAAQAPECYIDVVAGSLTPDLDALRAEAARLGDKVSLHIDAQNVAALMCGADLAIGAGGTMTWERNCLGLPSIILVLADNQDMVGQQMSQTGAGVVLDARSAYPEDAVGAALRRLANDKQALIDLSEAATKLSGKNGAEIAADILVSHILGGRPRG